MQRMISANISEEAYQKAKEKGMKWGVLIELGLEVGDLNAENRLMKQQIQKLEKAREKLQLALLDRGD